MTGLTVREVASGLEYSGVEGFVGEDAGRVSPDRAFVWDEVKRKFGVEATFFHGNVPVAFFKSLESDNDAVLGDLHLRLWNYNRAPLLFAVLPHEVVVYNCFAPPSREDPSGRSATAILSAVKHVNTALEVRQHLGQFRREEVESGRLARDNAKLFARSQRCDQRLLANLRLLRRSLISDRLGPRFVNDLIGRSVFIRYLEDRQILTDDFLRDQVGATSYCDLLTNAPSKAYELFDFLANKFNGDVFPVSPEERAAVVLDDLVLLGSFLQGTDVRSGQTYFWAYKFDSIPIDLVSSIYEEFLHSETGQDEEQGTQEYSPSSARGTERPMPDVDDEKAFYTPPALVDFVLNEVLPWDAKENRLRVLDPACGSGIFLVEAYRRLVYRSQRDRQDKLGFSELRDLLTSCIFGVDLKGEAIKVASLSCNLALLDFLEPKSIWREARFPNLRDANLIESDFFDPSGSFNSAKYDLIVGNPPWRSQLGRHAEAYLKSSGHVVGDKQIAQAFLWKAPDLLAPGGKACLLAPSKGVLFNTSVKNREFRRTFFGKYQVWAIADFSAFRRSLFQNAIAPVAAVFYRSGAGSTSDDLWHFAPHPSPLSESLSGVVISGDEVKRFSRRTMVESPNSWKIALWGTSRDLLFVQDLRSKFHTLGELEHLRRWLVREGLQVKGGGSRPAGDILSMPYVPANAIYPFQVTSSKEERLHDVTPHRDRDHKIYRAPHVLIRGGLLGDRTIAAAFLNHDAVFKDSVIAVAGPEKDADDLKLLCAYLNSSLAKYYHFLTASTWGVERPVIRKGEHLSFPCALPAGDPAISRRLVDYVDSMQSVSYNPCVQIRQDELDELVFAAYGLTDSERQLVKDTLRLTLDQLKEGINSVAFHPPTEAEMVTYARAFVEAMGDLGAAEGLALQPVIYSGSAPYRAVSFNLDPGPRLDREMAVKSEPGLDHELERLDRLILGENAEGIRFRRNLKVFEGRSVHVVKPNERRCWTVSAAHNDADDTISQVLSASLGVA